MKVESYTHGYDKLSQTWYMIFELEDGTSTDRWSFTNKIAFIVTKQLLDISNGLTLANIRGVMMIESVSSD